MNDLNAAEISLLKWLGDSEFSQLGECYGIALDRLVEEGLAQIHPPGAHQDSFIAQDPHGTKGDAFRAVSLTERGHRKLAEL